MPYERLGETFKDLFDCPISTGALTGMLNKSSDCAAPLQDEIKEKIKASEFMHNDETGLNILNIKDDEDSSKNKWLLSEP